MTCWVTVIRVSAAPLPCVRLLLIGPPSWLNSSCKCYDVPIVKDVLFASRRALKGTSDMVHLGEPAASLTDAIMELLNNPHPLDTLSETAAYGPDGAISRYHNPDNYTRAVAAIMRARTK